MQCLMDVHNKIFDENIELIDYRMTNGDAVTVKCIDSYGIFVDRSKFEDSGSEFVALAHEYGHCKSGATHHLSSPLEMIEQHEYRADRAAVHEFLPFEKIREAFEHGCAELWQLAEFLDMPEEFVKKAIEIYRAEGFILTY